jgi:interferon gamma-inducible protein 30
LSLTVLLLTSTWTIHADKAEPQSVKVNFIGESLCPDCAAFTTKVLHNVFSSGLNDLIELNYLGWGNAKNQSGTVTCQHGPRECKLNIALNCAQHFSKSQEAFFTFLDCLEREAFSKDDKEVLLTCSNNADIPVDDVLECTNGDLGKSSVSRLHSKRQCKGVDYMYVRKLVA